MKLGDQHFSREMRQVSPPGKPSRKALQESKPFLKCIFMKNRSFCLQTTLFDSFNLFFSFLVAI